MRLVSHVSPFTRKAPALVGVSTGHPTSDPVRWQAVHSQEFGSDRLRQMLPLRFVVDVAMTSFTQDNCLLHTRGRHHWDLSSTHSANREFFSTYSASQQKIQISHRNEVHSQRFFTQRQQKPQVTKGKPGRQMLKLYFQRLRVSSLAYPGLAFARQTSLFSVTSWL